MSTAGPRSPPCSCSGAMYAGVPSTVPVPVMSVRSTAFAMPRSASFTEPSLPEQDVGRLDVAVDDAGAVRVVERLGDGAHDLDRAARLDLAAREHVGERLPLHVLHDEQDGLVVLLGVEDRDEVRMAEGGAELGLALEAAGVHVVVLGGMHPLDGHIAVEPLVARQVDGRHAARAKPADHPIPVCEQGSVHEAFRTMLP